MVDKLILPPSQLPTPSEPWGKRVTSLLQEIWRNSQLNEQRIVTVVQEVNAATSFVNEQQNLVVTAAREPLPPTGIELDSEGYWNAQGTARSRVTVAWDAVTRGMDEQSISVAQYEVWGLFYTPDDTPPPIAPAPPLDPEPVAVYPFDPGEEPTPEPDPGPDPEPDPEPEPGPADPIPNVNNAPMVRLTATRNLQAVIDNLTPGNIVEVAVRSQSAQGVWSEFSSRQRIATEAIVMALPKPSTPTLESSFGTVTASWNGLDEDGEPVPVYVIGAQAYWSATSATGPWTKLGFVPSNGSAVLTFTDTNVYGDTIWVKLNLIDQLSREGEDSAVANIAVAGGEVLEAIEEAQQNAEDALAAAAEAVTTADGKNNIYASSSTPSGTHTQGDLWYELDGSGRVINVKIWNGSTWVDYQIVADSVLVPGSAGTVSIADGAVTAPKIFAGAVTAGKIAADAIEANNIQAGAITGVKIAATAIDGKTITGALIQSETTPLRGVKIDSNGIRAYNGAGDLQFSVDAATGQLTAVNGSFTGSINATSGEIAGDLNITGLLHGTGMIRIGAYEIPSTLIVGPGYIHQRWLGDEDNIEGRFVTLGMGELRFGTPTRAFDPNDIDSIYDSARAIYYGGGIDYIDDNGDGAPNSFARIAANGRLLLQPKNGVRINPGDFVAPPPVTLTSTDHPFQIGPNTGSPALVADNSRIQVRYLGAGAPLALNPLGGNVDVGNSGSAVTIPGSVTLGGPDKPASIGGSPFGLVLPTATAVAGGGSATIDAANGFVTMTGIGSISLTELFASGDDAFSVFEFFWFVTASPAPGSAQPITMGLAGGTTTRDTLRSAVRSFNLADTSIEGGGSGTATQDAVVIPLANVALTGAVVHGYVYHALSASERTKIEFDVTSDSSGGTRMAGYLYNSSISVDDGLRLARTGAGTVTGRLVTRRIA